MVGRLLWCLLLSFASVALATAQPLQSTSETDSDSSSSAWDALLRLDSIALAIQAESITDSPIDQDFMDQHFLDGFQQITTNTFNAQKRAEDTIDYTKLVNPFIGTGATDNPGNVFPGASVPFGMAKLGIDVDSYAPAGYNDDMTAPVRGFSILHDSGTGSSSGSFGNNECQPLICTNDDYQLCPVTLDDRKRLRKRGKDVATPGYFSTTLNNSIQMEGTTTRRAGLMRYTFPKSSMEKQNSLQPALVLDWTNDLPGTFRGGEMSIDPVKGRILMNGTYGSSFASGLFSYDSFACFDLLADGQQEIGTYGLFSGDRLGQDTKLPNATFAYQVRNTIGGAPHQRGALVTWKKTMSSGKDQQVLVRFGVSYVSAEQACSNAEEEIPQYDFQGVVDQSKKLWNEKLGRVQISNETDKHVAELIYSSFYRQFLSPNNATLETQGQFAGTSAPYFDGLYCSWDTYRTFYPLLSLTSPQDYAEIVENYIDGWRKTGQIPECRANNVPGLTQGEQRFSPGTNILADFAVKYAKSPMSVDIDELYAALVSDATNNSVEWNNGGRQIGVYEAFGYLPFAVYDVNTTGRQTREGSRTLEYANNDFAVRNVALLLGKQDEAERWSKRALFYKNVFDPNTKSLGFSNFVQRRYTNGTFGHVDPTFCSPIDNSSRSCSLQQENVWGVYETSAWEYSLYAPQDFAGLIELLAEGDKAKFIKRVDKFFDAGLFYSGNEPSFQTPTVYHYANRPTKSVDRVRNLVYKDFNTTNAGLPGNDDNGAMATLLLFHLFGLYPVPSTREFLVVSPFLPAYTLINTLLGTVTVTAKHFDKRSLREEVPQDARAYVKSVTINGHVQSSRCKIMFEQLFPGRGQHSDVVFEMATKDQVTDCGPSAQDLPSSMSTGGFDHF
ncbi:hypothetical protein CBS101457_004849 [Exobasidium rhododendri]|nr:hypothetical protein CBS101457_004849 [Exobasidium rhododendri]